VIDYSLARRATLWSLYSGGATKRDVCDAHPDLLRAARFHGEPTESPCPVCRGERLRQLMYVYGDELGRYSGRIKERDELETMAHEYGEFRVYVVEVCRRCAWNHLTSSFVLGSGTPRQRSRGRAARGARAEGNR
jgi:hypothetical protein